jgi:hypothetical protein
VAGVLDEWIAEQSGGPATLAQWPFGDMQLGRALDALAKIVEGVGRSRQADVAEAALAGNAA